MKGLSKVQIILSSALLLIVVAAVVTFSYFKTKAEIKHDSNFLNQEISLLTSASNSRIEVAKPMDAAYAIGYEHAYKLRWSMFIQQIVLEGRAAEFFGKKYASFDYKIRSLELSPLADSVIAKLPKESLNYLTAYVQGVNEATIHKGRWLDIRFAEHDVKPFDWTASHSIQLWLATLILNNSSVLDDLFLTGIGMKLEPDIRRTLFQALPRADPSHPSLMLPNRHASEVLDLYQSIKELTIHIGLANYHLDGIRLFRAFDTGFESIIGLYDNNHYDTPWMASEIDYPTDSYLYITKAGIPFSFARVNQKNQHFWALGSQNDRIAQIESTPNRTDIAIKAKATVIKEEGGGLTIDEYSYNESSLILNEWIDRQEKATNLYERYYRLRQLASVDDYTQTLAALFDNSFRIEHKDPVKSLMLYHQYTFKDALLRFVPHAELSNFAESEPSWIPMNIHPLRKKNTLKPFQLQEDGFIISNGDLIISNNERYFNHWQTDPFTLEYIQTELMLSMKADSTKVLSDNLIAYSPFAAKIIQEILNPTILKELTNTNNLIFEYFENWNYEFDANSSAATLFEYFYQILLKNVFLDDIGEDYYKEFKTLHGLHSVLMLYCLSNNSSIFDDNSTTARESKNELIQKALEEAVIAVRREFGTETEEWRWENYLKLANEFSNMQSIQSNVRSKVVEEPTMPPNFGHWSSVLKLKNAHLFREKEIMQIEHLLYLNTKSNQSNWKPTKPSKSDSKGSKYIDIRIKPKPRN